MKKIGLVIFCGLIAMSAVFAGGQSGSSASASTTAPYTIEVGGSTSVTPLMERLAAEFEKQRPNIKININGTGSGDGINNAGTLYQIGMSSRDLTPAERGRGFNIETIAIDGIAVIVNNSNPVSDLTVEQVRGIFTGEITDWGQVSGGAKSGPIAVISREEGSGTRGAFEEIIGFQGRLVRGANEFTSTGAIISSISTNPDAIGYISLGSVNNNIRAISVGGYAPSTQNVQRGTYRVARPFIVLSGNNIHPESQAFLDFIMSTAGQDIVSTGWIRVN